MSAATLKRVIINAIEFYQQILNPTPKGVTGHILALLSDGEQGRDAAKKLKEYFSSPDPEIQPDLFIQGGVLRALLQHPSFLIPCTELKHEILSKVIEHLARSGRNTLHYTSTSNKELDIVHMEGALEAFLSTHPEYFDSCITTSTPYINPYRFNGDCPEASFDEVMSQLNSQIRSSASLQLRWDLTISEAILIAIKSKQEVASDLQVEGSENAALYSLKKPHYARFFRQYCDKPRVTAEENKMNAQFIKDISKIISSEDVMAEQNPFPDGLRISL